MVARVRLRYDDASPEIALEPPKVRVLQILVGNEEDAKLIRSRILRGEDFATLRQPVACGETASPQAVESSPWADSFVRLRLRIK